MRKINCIFIAFILLQILLTACENPINTMRRPTSQAGSVWTSDDGLVRFETGQDSYSAKGSMIINGQTMEIYLSFDHGTGLEIHPVEVMDAPYISYETRFEIWVCSFKSMEKFTATVEETTYFEKGQTFTFHRVSP